MCFFCGYMILNAKGEMLYYKIVEQNGSDCSLLVDSTDLFFGISGGNFIKIYKINSFLTSWLQNNHFLILPQYFVCSS